MGPPLLRTAMSFYVIADEDTVLGFRYAGVPGEAARSPPQAIEPASPR